VGHNWGTIGGDSLVANRRQNKGLWCSAAQLTAECSTIELPGIRHPGVIAHLDILLETPYLHLGCLLKNKATASNCCKGPWTYWGTLLPGPAHGHTIAKAIEFNSEDVLQVEQGSLYPALHRLIKRGVAGDP
jgi:hypothetical protein